MKQWINYLKQKSLSSTTIKTYSSVRQVLGLNLEITKKQLKTMILDSSKSCNTQILYYYVALEFFKFYKKSNLTKYLNTLKLPAKPQKYMETISKTKIYNLLKKDFKNYYWVNIIILLFETGIRAQELKNIISVKEKSLVIKGKGNKIREVFCKNQTIKNLFEKNQKTNFFPFTTKTLRLKIKQYLGKGFTPHSLRRSFATHMLKAGANPKMVQMQLGHKKIETTYNYLHLSYDYNLKIYNKFI